MEGGGNGHGYSRKSPPVLTRQLSVVHRPKEENTTEKRSLKPSPSTVNRSLLDVIRNESTNNNDKAATQSVNWKTFKNRLILRRTIAAFSTRSSSSSCEHPAAQTPDSVPTPEAADPPRAAEPVRVSLMTLLEQADRMSSLQISDDVGKPAKEVAAEAEEEDEDEDGEMVHVCCVCMVRHKGAAFIPCGHTFCRLCSRELWVSGGNCPLCNGFILEILDIF